MTFGETELEQAIVNDPDWIAGDAWGKPRPGHPEGSVSAHLAEVLANVDQIAIDKHDRERLRFVALIHDHFKYQVDRSRQRTGENHHAMLARRFAERYTRDEELLDVIELHDDAFKAWLRVRDGKVDRGEQMATAVIERLGDSIDFYLRFFKADNATGSKEPDSYEWFRGLAGR